MQHITIGTKNQIVIPLEVRKKIKGLKPGKKVAVYALDKETIAIKVADQSWADSTYGLMKKSWQDIDPIQALEKMRDEWDEK